MAEAPASCPVCGTAGMAVIYESGTATSLSSLCQILPGPKIVSFCAHCGHLAGNGIADAAAFYASDYRILLDDEDEDQIYEIRGARVITRTGQQLAVLVEKVRLAPALQVLDYGCAKAAMARKMLDVQPDLGMHLFDVSRMYQPFWDRFTDRVQQAVDETPAEWDGRFDLVTSFFAFEHIAEPRTAMTHVARLLKPGGRFYMVVPDVAGNAADFIVADHVNHFTPTSAARLMSEAGFSDVSIDAGAHRGALVVTACKAGRSSAGMADASDKSVILKTARGLAAFWTGAARTVRASEAANPGSTGAAIYGSGFYGAFIHANLARPDRVACFLDQSPWRIGTKLFEVPVMSPQHLPAGIDTVYAGLNPAIARGIMEAQPWSGRDGLRIVYFA